MNVLFIPTSSSGIMHWRIQNFVESAWRQGLANFVNPLWFKDLKEVQPWQTKITDGPNYDAIFIRAFVPMIESGCIEADAVVFQSVHEEGAFELFEAIKIKFPHLPVFTEIDDNILSVPTYNEAHGVYAPGSPLRKRALDQIKQSDGVIVSTPYLREVYSAYNKNIWVIPNCIDFSLWGKAKRKARPGIRIGWAGGNGHAGDFELIEGVIKNVVKRHKDVRFVFVNGPAKNGLPEGLKDVERVEHHSKWEPILKYPGLIAGMDFDIGIAPLIDSAFNRGKSNLKWLEGCALSYPVVASNVGHFAETITNGVDGFLADTAEDFEKQLDALITDKKLRKQMGSAAHRRAREDFNVDIIVREYVKNLQEAISLKGAVPMGAA